MSSAVYDEFDLLIRYNGDVVFPVEVALLEAGLIRATLDSDTFDFTFWTLLEAALVDDKQALFGATIHEVAADGVATNLPYDAQQALAGIRPELESIQKLNKVRNNTEFVRLKNRVEAVLKDQKIVRGITIRKRVRTAFGHIIALAVLWAIYTAFQSFVKNMVISPIFARIQPGLEAADSVFKGIITSAEEANSVVSEAIATRSRRNGELDQKKLQINMRTTLNKLSASFDGVLDPANAALYLTAPSILSTAMSPIIHFAVTHMHNAVQSHVDKCLADVKHLFEPSYTIYNVALRCQAELRSLPNTVEMEANVIIQDMIDQSILALAGALKNYVDFSGMTDGIPLTIKGSLFSIIIFNGIKKWKDAPRLAAQDADKMARDFAEEVVARKRDGSAVSTVQRALEIAVEFKPSTAERIRQFAYGV